MKIDQEVLVAYVHFGTNFPKHLELNLARHRKMFPDQEIYLVCQETIEKKIKGIKYFELNLDFLEPELFEQMSNYLDFEFRDGFWKFTLQRLFALRSLHLQFPDKKLLHIESDVIIMPDFPWEYFSNSSKLSWLSVNNGSDVAALVFSPKASETEFLINQIRIYAEKNPAINDMFALWRFAQEFPNRHSYLPSLTENNSVDSLQWKREKDSRQTEIEGLFDPLALGLWYFGQDPKNSFGLVRRYQVDQSHYLNAKQTHLKIEHGKVKDMTGEPIYSLHIHTKELAFFGDDRQAALAKRFAESEFLTKGFKMDLEALKSSVKGKSVSSVVWQLAANNRKIASLRKYRIFEQTKDYLKKLLRL